MFHTDSINNLLVVLENMKGDIGRLRTPTVIYFVYFHKTHTSCLTYLRDNVFKKSVSTYMAYFLIV